MRLLRGKKDRGDIILRWPADIEIDMFVAEEDGDYIDVLRLKQPGEKDVVINLVHGTVRALAAELDKLKKDVFL